MKRTTTTNNNKLLFIIIIIIFFLYFIILIRSVGSGHSQSGPKVGETAKCLTGNTFKKN